MPRRIGIVASEELDAERVVWLSSFQPKPTASLEHDGHDAVGDFGDLSAPERVLDEVL